MHRYETNGLSDAVGAAAAELVESIRSDELTRLRPWGRSGESKAVPAPAGPGARAADPGFRAADLANVRDIVEEIRRLMFPGFFDSEPLWDGELEPRITRQCDRIARSLADEVRNVLRYRRAEPGAETWSVQGDEEFVNHVVGTFIRRLGEVRRLLGLDVQAAYDGDPAAEHTDEIILCYPGLDAIFTHRVAHELYGLNVPLLARVMSEQAHSRTGIDIHPGAKIGESFFIDHGSATVIGETSTIGRQVKIYQGVTLGARSFPKDERGRVIRGIRRHPTIGDRVTIYAGAVILGGDTVIGDDCVIAGGVFVTSSVAPGHVVQQTRPEPVLKPTASSKPAKPVIEEPPRPQSVDLGWMQDGAGI